MVYQPNDAFGEGESLNGAGANNGGQGQTVGQEQGDTQRGTAQVPVSDVLGQYSDAASRAVDRGEVPAALRDAIGDYFDRLTEQVG